MAHPKAQIIYFSHGGGPLPILGDPGHQKMVEFMTALPKQLRRPDAILVISAHWEENIATLLGASDPPLLYDYFGFPESAYAITYPAHNNPALVEKIVRLLGSQGVPTDIDMERGFDHGVFIPLKLIYPASDIPTLQLSLLQSLDPSEHIALGRALRALKNENILIIGSGFSFHNQHAFFTQATGAPDPANEAFQDWLIETVTEDMPQTTREERLIHWEKAPFARYCHPREEHLLPLHVCAGIAEQPGTLIFNDTILGKRGVAFLWQ